MLHWLKLAAATGSIRQLPDWRQHAVRGFAFLTALWSIYQSVWSDGDVMVLTIVFLAQILALTFLCFTPTASARRDRLPLVEVGLAILALVAGAHFGVKTDEIATRIALFDPLTPWDIFFSSSLLILTVEAARRTIGLDMAVLVLLFFLYNLYGNVIGGLFGHSGVSYLHFIEISFFTTDGVFGAPLRVAATYAFLFVIFGNLLTKSGGGEFFYKLAAAATGRKAGGTAKVAVISSGLFGSVSGNPVADVVTTGSITIPVMVRTGFKPKVAAAIEATASNGGALMPPVLGAAAFIMAEFTGIEYADIALAALIPAVLYYGSLYAQVHFYSRRHGLRGLTEAEIPRLGETLREGWPFILPIVVLVTVLFAGYSPSLTAFAASIAVVAAAAFRADTRLSLKSVYEQLAESAERMIPVGVACASAGMILAGMTMTGMAGKFSQLITFVSDANILVALLCAGVMTNLLGLGLPTSSTYILSAVLTGGILIKFGVDVMQAHLFLLYYASLSALTPPVAIASYVAAAIANTNPFITSLYSMRKALVAFLVPFGFVLDPGLILRGDWLNIVVSCITSGAAVVLLAAAIEGFMLTVLQRWERTLLAVAGLFLLVGTVEWKLAGALLAAIGLARGLTPLVLQRLNRAASTSAIPAEENASQ